MSQLFEYVLRLGDNALILGQQLGEWVGHSPEMEEDMALANFALDYVGQARMFLSYAGEIEGGNRGEDELAFLRDQIDFRNVLLAEQPNGHFGATITRQFLFESFYQLQLDALAESTDNRLAAIAAKARKENQYHLRHARQWLIRLGDGTAESHDRVQTSIDALWCFTGELFEPDDVEHWAAEQGIGPDLETLKAPWEQFVADALKEATLDQPENPWMDVRGKLGQHTEHLGYLLADMQFLQRAYPGASW